jgi:hypothetical protein
VRPALAKSDFTFLYDLAKAGQHAPADWTPLRRLIRGWQILAEFHDEQCDPDTKWFDWRRVFFISWAAEKIEVRGRLGVLRAPLLPVECGAVERRWWLWDLDEIKLFRLFHIHSPTDRYFDIEVRETPAPAETSPSTAPGPPRDIKTELTEFLKELGRVKAPDAYAAARKRFDLRFTKEQYREVRRSLAGDYKFGSGQRR